MTRILSLTLLTIIGATHIYAQTPTLEKKQFNPHWNIQLQGGIGHTLGEADLNKLISPAAALSVGRQFTPVWGLKFGVSGWEAKGARFNPSQVYEFNFMQVNADVTVDVANLIGGFKCNRTVNPYVLLGVGGNVGFNNTEAKALNDAGYKMSLLWTDRKFFVAGRAGAGVNFRLSDRVKVGLEVNTNMLSDKFNSKKADNVDWQMNALAGLTFRIGKIHKKSVAIVPAFVAPAQTQVVREIEKPIEPTPAVETPAPVIPVQNIETPAPVIPVQNIETPAPVIPVQNIETPAPVAKKDAPAPPSPETYKIRQDLFFAINSFVVRDSEQEKIEALVASLKADPKARVSIVGYADAPTGSSIGNYWLSGWRALKVKDALKSKGVSSSRIDMNFVGDKEQPYSDVEDNRIVICIVR